MKAQCARTLAVERTCLRHKPKKLDALRGSGHEGHANGLERDLSDGGTRLQHPRAPAGRARSLSARRHSEARVSGHHPESRKEAQPKQQVPSNPTLAIMSVATYGPTFSSLIRNREPFSLEPSANEYI